MSPIRTNNDASVNSTTGGFNFRKLKPIQKKPKTPKLASIDELKGKLRAVDGFPGL